MPKPNPHVAAMSPYALAQIFVPPGKTPVSLSQNESLRPPSPKTIEAAGRAASETALYPDPDCTRLREALGALHGIDPEGIVCGNGSLDLIGCLARAYAGPGASVLAPEHAYPFFRTAAQSVGANFVTAPEDDCTASIDALLAAVRPETAIVFLANPGNPTGTRVPKSELQRLRNRLEDNVLLVIDEAYGEFADHLGERTWDIVARGDTVVLRTFSKAYGLAGFRVGWGMFPPDVAGELRKIINPNAVSHPAQAAALAALEDQPYMAETCALTSDLREEACRALLDAGFDARPSLTNFLLIHFAGEAKAQSAERTLQTEGIVLRRQQGAGLPHALRMTIGPEKDLLTAINQLKHWNAENTP